VARHALRARGSLGSPAAVERSSELQAYGMAVLPAARAAAVQSDYPPVDRHRSQVVCRNDDRADRIAAAELFVHSACRILDRLEFLGSPAQARLMCAALSRGAIRSHRVAERFVQERFHEENAAMHSRQAEQSGQACWFDSNFHFRDCRSQRLKNSMSTLADSNSAIRVRKNFYREGWSLTFPEECG
jgi:hypothetical protein